MEVLPIWARIAVNLWFVPMHLAVFAFQNKLLTARSSHALKAFRLFIICLVLILDDQVINPSSMVSIFLTGVAMPLVCFNNPMHERISLSAIIVTVGAFAELLGVVMWMWLVPGAASADYIKCIENYPEHVIGMLAGLFVECVCLILLARSWILSCEEVRRKDAQASMPFVLAIFPVVQAGPILALATAVMITPTTKPGLLLMASLPCGLCLLAEVAVLAASGSVRRYERAKAQVAELHAELNEAQKTSKIELKTELTLAQMRHDARNTANIAMAYIASNRLHDASKTLRDAANLLEKRGGQ